MSRLFDFLKQSEYSKSLTFSNNAHLSLTASLVKMHFSTHLLSLLSLTTAISAADHINYEHEYVEDGIIEDLTFGAHGAIWSKDHRHITGWKISGKDYTPELHSDRVILTPPWPANKRGSIWAEHAETNKEWEVEFEFRATGPETGSGNLQFWYVRSPSHDVGYSSIYTVGKWEGVAIVATQYGTHGGTLRAYLNDGTLDFKSHHWVDQLSFGSCDFNYRNLGKFSKIKISQTFWNFAVEVDGKECIRTHKVCEPLIEELGELTRCRSISRITTTTASQPPAPTPQTPSRSPPS